MHGDEMYAVFYSRQAKYMVDDFERCLCYIVKLQHLYWLNPCQYLCPLAYVHILISMMIHVKYIFLNIR